MNTSPTRSYTHLAIAIIVAAVVISASVLSYSSFEATVTRTGTTITDTSTLTSTSTETITLTYMTTSTVTMPIPTPESVSCSIAGNESNPLNSFNVEVAYTGSWSAIVSGYTYGATTPAFVSCYTGSGDGVVSIASWVQNQTAGLMLNVDIQKTDAGRGNLTATLGDMVKSTTVVYGSVVVFAITVP
jgi:hypothetical protein